MARFCIHTAICGFIWTFISFSVANAQLKERTPSERLLPASTKAWVSISDLGDMIEQFNGTGIGQLSKSDEMAPFFESLHEQVRSYLNENNLKLGIQFKELREIRTGELAFAGVLYDADPAQGGATAGVSHGIVLLSDVAGNELQASELLERIANEMLEQGAVRETVQPIHGVSYSKFLISLPEKPKRFVYQCLVDGWLIASDSDVLFRDILQRVKNPIDPNQLDRLSEVSSFQKVQQRTEFPGVTPHLRWFAEPFGYIELANSIRAEKRLWKQSKDDLIPAIRKSGFDLLDGLGGMVAFNKSEHDAVHRTFVSMKPHRGANRVAAMLDFKNKWGLTLDPPAFAPLDASAFLTLSWNMQGAFNNVEPLVDAILGEKTFETTVQGIKADFKVDLEKFVGSLDNNMLVISRTRRPIEMNSEQIAICIKIRENQSQVRDDLFRMVKGTHTISRDEKRGIEYIVVDNRPLDDDDDDWLDFDKQFNQGKNDPGDKVEQFRLFEQRHFVVHHNYIIVTNNLEFMYELIDGPIASLGDAADFQQVITNLAKVCNNDRIFYRQFGRLDRMLEVNYEMMRQGKMGAAETAIARILNAAFKAEEPENRDKQRVQQIDAALLPADYESAVSSFLGPSGTVGEVLEDGWLWTGMMLKKKALSNSGFAEDVKPQPRR